MLAVLGFPVLDQGPSALVVVRDNGYEFAAGTSRALLHRAALTVTVIIVLIAMFDLAYAWAMKQRAVLR